MVKMVMRVKKDGYAVELRKGSGNTERREANEDRKRQANA
jgi:hypothetical protein